MAPRPDPASAREIADPMRLSVLLSALAAVLLAGAVAAASLTIWAVLRSEALGERIALARASQAEHLVLQSNLYRLFKEKADALLIGDRDLSALEGELSARIDANLAEIQRIIALEIGIDGEEELEELRLLSEIEQAISDIMQQYDALLLASSQSGATTQRDLVTLLDREIDVTLSEMIAFALAGEAEEVAEAQEDAARSRAFVKALAAIILGLVILATGGAGLVYRRRVMRPLADLVAGAEALREGRLDTRIAPRGAAELRQLAATLSDMAERLESRDRDLRTQARRLEVAVAERTSELQSILTQFEQAESSRRQMMADVSHELRTPLTIIQGEADIALRAGQTEPALVAVTFSRIRDAARHSNRIVDDLLLVAREEAGHLRLDLRNVDLDAALAEAAGLAQARIEVLRLGRPAPARVDPVRLRQCLLAVMNNALRYGGRNVRAWVELRDDGHDIVIEDDGPGMSDSEKDQAFNRFFRGSGAQSTGVEGTGLGLPIVRSIMNAHGGSVDLSDRDGGGLIVRLRFAATLRGLPAPVVEIPLRRVE